MLCSGLRADLLYMLAFPVTVLRRGLGRRGCKWEAAMVKNNLCDASGRVSLAGEKRGSRGGGTATSGPGCNLPMILEHRRGSSN